MNFFARNDFGDRTGGTFRGNPYVIGQTAGPTRQILIDRINSTIGSLGDLYNRNANLPLQFRVPGSDYAVVGGVGDALYKKYVIPYNDIPDSPYWTQTADTGMRSAVDDFQRRVFDFSESLRVQEKAHQDAVAAAEAAGQEEASVPPEEVSTTPGTSTSASTKSNLPLYIGLGVVAVAAFVGAALLSPEPEETSGQVQTLPTGSP